DERLKSESIGAMDIVEQVFVAAQHRWAGDFDAASLRPFLQPHAGRARDLMENGDPRVRPFASAIVSITTPALASAAGIESWSGFELADGMESGPELERFDAAQVKAGMASIRRHR
ncbi:MAG TPA: hypothetical protein VEL28_18480, partial [Candidatus Binatia bacterium]|nr:hypothetical protein [Candidatus Binatia bacterium]